MNDLDGAAERQRRLWARYAPRYDREMRLWERLLFGDARAWACTQATGDVLDVAIGSGRNLPFYPADVRLTGVDLSPEMLELARNRAAELGRQVDLREGDAHQLSFPDASFDTVVCTFSLCNIPDERRAIAEMHRVLRPDGLLVLADHVASDRRLILGGQRLLEKFTVRKAGDHQTRRPLPLVEQAGFTSRPSSATARAWSNVSPPASPCRSRRWFHPGAGEAHRGEPFTREDRLPTCGYESPDGVRLSF